MWFSFLLSLLQLFGLFPTGYLVLIGTAALHLGVAVPGSLLPLIWCGWGVGLARCGGQWSWFPASPCLIFLLQFVVATMFRHILAVCLFPAVRFGASQALCPDIAVS